MKRLSLIGVLITALLCGCVKQSVTAIADAPDQPSGGLFGTITDYSTGEPIDGADITLNPDGKSTKTGSDGRYEFKDLDIMQYTVMVQKEGYRTNRKTVTVISGESVRADIPLIKNE